MSIYNTLPVTRIKIGIAKILYRFVRVFYGKNNFVISRSGIYYEIDLTEGIDLSLFLFGSFQKHIISRKFARLTDHAIVLDVGANFGAISLQFARLIPQGIVYAFEPTHYALKKLKRNISLNPVLSSRIKVYNTFVSSRSTAIAELKAFSSWDVSGRRKENLHPIHLGEEKSTDGVGAISLDDFCNQNKLTRVDLIKIDTDGHEPEVLQGAKEIISKFRPYIIFEIGMYIMEEKGIDFLFYVNYFKELNFQLINSRTGAIITMENHKTHIPSKGSIDILAAYKD